MTRSRLGPTLFIYSLMLVACVGLFFVIRAVGEDLTAQAQKSVVGSGEDVQPAKTDALLHVLIALIAVIITGRILAWLFSHVGQPPVIGEVVAGILLGPSLLGKEFSSWILPASVAPYLGVIAQIGVILYMFLVGLELNAGLLKSRSHATIAISHASIVAPFTLGAALALWLYPILSHREVSFTSFALFMGVAMAITAFPVLARILADLRMDKTELGVMALSCAAINDVTAWCLLALVVGIAQAHVGEALVVAGLALGFIVLMIAVVRPLARRFVRRWENGPLESAALAWVLAAVLLSALATEAIGIHAIFGAFLLGAVVPHDSRFVAQIGNKLHGVVTTLLLPAFFAYTGMRTEIRLISGLDQWLMCIGIILGATAGKLGGSVLAARWTGLNWRTSTALGVLMNTRGLMELIVLNIGLDLGVISPTLFAMMVLMALVTTIPTTPIVRWILRESSPTSLAAVQARIEGRQES